MIYLDNNSTTKLDDEVLLSMMPFFKEKYGNASNSKNIYGREANAALLEALHFLCSCFNSASVDDFIITSGATEANNLAISGILANQKRKKHIIVSGIEHASVLRVAQWWESHGFKCSYLHVDEKGVVSIKELEESISNDTCLISIMSANNEIGTIQPIECIAKIAKERNVLFHTDATQYLYYGLIDTKIIPADLISFSAHKFHGPKGIGCLYANENARNALTPIILGGGQQNTLRSGTINIPGVIGMAKALEIQSKNQKAINSNISALRNLFIETLKKHTNFYINGCMEHRIVNNLNICFPGISANALIGLIPEIAISTGAACSSNNRGAYNQTLTEIGLSRDQIRSSVRIGFSKYTTKDEVLYAASTIATTVEHLHGRS